MLIYNIDFRFILNIQKKLLKKAVLSCLNNAEQYLMNEKQRFQEILNEVRSDLKFLKTNLFAELLELIVQRETKLMKTSEIGFMVHSQTSSLR